LKEGREAYPVIEKKYLPRTELDTGSSYPSWSSNDDECERNLEDDEDTTVKEEDESRQLE
jgi:hypothetical protein